MKFNQNGAVVYDGPSDIDGKRIVAILTGLKTPSGNPKTGTMAQLWILVADEAPGVALRSGADESICGGCPLRGILGKQRACYVQMHGPSSVWKAWKRGVYAEWDGRPLKVALRLGAYGDPGALPLRVVRRLVEAAPKGHTGYTHQWANLSPEWRGLVMASADDESEAAEAQRRGWRTFRVVPKDAQKRHLPSTEIMCPATPAGGMRVQCADCRLCKGYSKGVRSIAAPAHGSGAKYTAAETR